MDWNTAHIPTSRHPVLPARPLHSCLPAVELVALQMVQYGNPHELEALVACPLRS